MTHPVQKYLKASGYAAGDALTGGPGSSARTLLVSGVAATTLACLAALFAQLELGFVALLVGAVFLASLTGAAISPPLALEARGIRRGGQLIPWANVRGCQRVVTRNQAFMEFTFVDANGREQTQRSLAATALYRRLVEDEAKAPEPAADAPEIEARTEPRGYRDAPQPKVSVVEISSAPSTSWWSALLRYFSVRR